MELWSRMHMHTLFTALDHMSNMLPFTLRFLSFAPRSGNITRFHKCFEAGSSARSVSDIGMTNTAIAGAVTHVAKVPLSGPRSM